MRRLLHIATRVATLQDLERGVRDRLKFLSYHLETKWLPLDDCRVRFTMYDEVTPKVLIEAKIPVGTFGGTLDRQWPYVMEDSELQRIYDADRISHEASVEALAEIGTEAWQYVRDDALKARDDSEKRQRLVNAAYSVAGTLSREEMGRVREEGSAEFLRSKVENMLLPEISGQDLEAVMGFIADIVIG